MTQSPYSKQSGEELTLTEVPKKGDRQEKRAKSVMNYFPSVGKSMAV